MDMDERLKALITYVGNLEIPLRENLYASLIRSINGQLLSEKVADIIHSRLLKLLHNEINVKSVSRISDQELRRIGISARKVSYIRELTDKIICGDIILEDLYNKENHEAIQRLTLIKGIGQWTAKMFLIFSLGREDILALKDVGLHRCAKWLYQLDSNQSGLEKLKEKSESWRPYRTIASFYLWEIVTRNYINEYENVFELTCNIN